MDSIAVIRNFMVENGLNYLLVNSTNEFLVEYSTLEENSRYKLTGFSGSTGEALVTPDKIYLFVDGRYHIQADNEVDHERITVVKLQTGQKYLEELINLIPENEILGIFAKKNSQKKYEILSQKRQIKLLNFDPLDSENIPNYEDKNVKIDIKYTGLSTEEKISKISSKLSENEVLYVTDLDEVSYLFNMRNFSQSFSAKIRAKALIFKDKFELFTQSKLSKLEQILKDIDKKVFVDKNTINAFDFSILKDKVCEIEENQIAMMKAQKNDAELNHLVDAFNRTDKAVSATRDYIYNNDNLSEYDIAKYLEEQFKAQGAIGLSFNSIVAKDENSALAHYSKSSKDEIVKGGSLVLIDCGGYFEGGLATDITRVFVKGEPTKLHKKIYTTVLKAFLRSFNYAKTHLKRPLIGYDVAKSAHEFFDSQDVEGFVFNHGLGHGIGINVHEYPPNLSIGELAKVEIKDGMCFSIEPGLYREGYFGVRLENSCYCKDNDIHSFVHMNYEKKLIDFDMLNEQEKLWLDEFEVK